MKWTQVKSRPFVVPGIKPRQPAAYKPQGRTSASLQLIDESLYLFGGADEKGALNDTWIFNKSVHAWCPFDAQDARVASSRTIAGEHDELDGTNTTTATKKSLLPLNIRPPPRAGHATYAFDGDPSRMWMFGGSGLRQGKGYNDMWVMDVAQISPRWEQIAPEGTAPTARMNHTAVTIGDLVLIYGGESQSCEPLSDVQAYDFRRNRWLDVRNVFSTPAPRQLHTAVRHNYNMVVIGGVGSELRPPKDPVLIYDAEMMMWTSLRTYGQSPFDNQGTLTSLCGHATFAVEDKIVVFGGLRLGECVNHIWILDLLSNRWAKVDCSADGLERQTPASRWKHVCAPGEGGGSAFMFGGMGKASAHKEKERLGDLWELSLM